MKKRIIKIYRKNTSSKLLLALLFFLFVAHLFLRFYDFQTINPFGWDQVDNAWAAKNIIVEHKFPLVGMVAKGNSGFYIGPLYYYFVSGFYFLTNLDPIASGIIAGVTSIFTFATLFYFIKKLFSLNVAFVAVFIHTFSSYVIGFDRIQWPVNFIAPISLIIFYFLYKTLTGNPRYLLLLSIALGVSFHLNFTSIFFPIIILFSLPFFPRNWETVKYLLISIPIFILFFVPNIIYELNSRATGSKNMSLYLKNYYHGFHLVRFFQLKNDAFIEIEGILISKNPIFIFLKNFIFLIIPIFTFIYLFKKVDRNKLILSYLIALWFIVPWVVFSVYSGEISNYYFSLTRPIVVMIIAYLIVEIFQAKNFVFKVTIIIFTFYYSFTNINAFLQTRYRGVDYYRKSVDKTIKSGKVIQFTEGVPESYIYYLKTKK